jgi:hypothetical protein
MHTGPYLEVLYTALREYRQLHVTASNDHIRIAELYETM